MLLQRLYRVLNCKRILYRNVLRRNNYTTNKRENSVQLFKNSLLITSPTFAVMSIMGLMKKKDKSEKNETSIKEILARADDLFNQGEYKSIYELLSNYKDSKDVEILWRLSRAIYNMSKTASDVEAQKLILEGYDLICNALDIQEEHYAVHKWMAIFLESKSTLEGTKAHINELHNIKKHMLRASEINPTDATTLYMLGTWCYEISNLTWYQRKIASVIFGEPPNSSFAEALIYYENAEKVDPNFYSLNLLMLGKTYLKLERKDDAIEYLKKVVEFPVRNDDDQKAKQEAQKILNSI